MEILFYLVLLLASTESFTTNSSPLLSSFTRTKTFETRNIFGKDFITYFTNRQIQSPASASLLVLRGGGGGGGSSELCTQAYEWCVNLQGPSALVAGAVVATLYENYRQGALKIQDGDTPYSQFAKLTTNVLLLSAFALQIVSIFVSTVTGTMLMSQDFSHVHSTIPTALGFLKQHFEFEYLTIRVCFLQGLLNWLAGVAMEYTIPRDEKTKSVQYLTKFMASFLGTLILFILSFYNNHLTFYGNYFGMLSRWSHVLGKRYFGAWPPRPMMGLYLPGMIWSATYLFRALRPHHDVEQPSHSNEEEQQQPKSP